jgi:hypothetical protein
LFVSSFSLTLDQFTANIRHLKNKGKLKQCFLAGRLEKLDDDKGYGQRYGFCFIWLSIGAVRHG